MSGPARKRSPRDDGSGCPVQRSSNRVDPDPAEAESAVLPPVRAPSRLCVERVLDTLDNAPPDPEDTRLGGDGNSRPANGQSVRRHAGLDRASTDGAPYLRRP